jgi:peptidoglycan/xylan/chitin deacetylase (PgdA/CDA1 family)
MKVPAFLFHRVGPVKKNWSRAMEPALFDKTIQHLTKKFQIRTVEDYFLNDNLSSSDSRPFACVSFDDGFKDNIEYAAPILKKYNCPASFYLVTDSIDRNVPTWVHIYKQIMAETCLSDLSIESSFFANNKIEIKFKSGKERREFANALFEKIKKIPQSDQQSVLKQIQHSFYDVEIPGDWMLSWDHVNQLKNEGFMIGSHTKTHPFLSALENEDAIMSEFSDSASRIKEMTGDFPQTISYPAGDFNSRVKKLATSAGYQLGLSVTQERYDEKANELMEIPRIDLYADAGWTKTYLRIHGTLQKIKKIVRNR